MRRRTTRAFASVLLLLSLCAFPQSSKAELQFDIFIGYDNYVREAGWFPLVCEVFNDGPGFNAVVEITAGQIRSDQVRRIPIELPTNTRKRFVVPMFASAGRFVQWNAQLLDERGRVQAERQSLQPKFVSWEGYLMGALPRSFAGMPTLPDVAARNPELKPQAARLLVEQLPDHPIALEALDAIYLNSEKALELKVNHVAALLAWIQNGGKLIVAVEQLTDVTATPWLQQILPAELSGFSTVSLDEELYNWLRQPESMPSRRTSLFSRAMLRPGGGNLEGTGYRDLKPDPALLNAEINVVTGKVRDGEVVATAKGLPLIIQAERGRGMITLLMFNPEREPLRTWKDREWVWSKLLEVPSNWYVSQPVRSYGGASIDGVFGALIDSRQVRKLPVQWLLALLVVYLLVIGPFDQYWLKKIGRQMLTWVTFPTYVVLFSLLIYFIGYKLRAGQTEWNELHVVDILPRTEQRAELRGRTYASVYSSSNARYPLAFTPPSADLADRTHATLRGELVDLFGRQEGARANIVHYGNTFRAEVFVPVWTSLLYVNDWLQPADLPLIASISEQGAHWEVTIQNFLDRPLKEARIVIAGRVHDLEELPAGQKKVVKVSRTGGVQLESFVQQHGGGFHFAVERRRNPLGDGRQGWIDNPSLNAMVASFASLIPAHQGNRSFVAPPGLDLTPAVDRGDTVLFAWDPGQSFTNPLNQFKPPISQRNTLLRLVIPGKTTTAMAAASGG